MSKCAFARVRAAVVACAVFVGNPATAQEAAPQLPAQAPAPPSGEATLPEIVVKTPAEAKTKKASKTKSAGNSKSSGAVAAEGNAQSAPPSDPNATKPETATGPFKGYFAKQSATGIKTDTPIKEIPQSITVVGAEQIRDQGATTLQETLHYVPGVVADGYGFDGRTDSSLIRGTEAAEYLDGLRRTFSYYINNFRIDPYFMERIEVLRGPASVLYGQAPVGGIINAVSKRPQEEEYREVTVEYGTHDWKQVKTDMTGKLTEDGKWLYRITGLARDADTQVDYVEDDRLAISPAITYRPVAGTSITLLGHFRDDNSGTAAQFFPHVGTRFPSRSGFIDRDRFGSEPDFEKYDTTAASGSLFVDSQLTDTFRVRHNLRYTDIHNDYNGHYPSFFYGDTGQGANFPYSDPLDRTVTRVKYISNADTQVLNTDTNLEAKFETGPVKHKVLGGADTAMFLSQSRSGSAIDQNPFDLYAPVYGQPEHLGIPNYDPVTGAFTGFTDVSSVPMYETPDQDLTQTGLYVQDQIRLGNWIAVLGARRDWITNKTKFAAAQKDESTTYRAGLMYEFPSGLTPYVSYAESFVPVVGLDRHGDTFDPQAGVMYEAGFKYQPPGAAFAINGALYDITESNRLSTDAVDPNYSVQAGEVSIRGVEIEVVGNLTRSIKVAGGYSYTDAEYTSGDQAGLHVESVPAHLASLWAMYTFHEGLVRGWSVGAGVRYIGTSWDGSDTLKTPAVGLVDAAIAYETDDYRFAVNATNLEDKVYMSTCLSRGDCFIGTARTVISSFTYKF